MKLKREITNAPEELFVKLRWGIENLSHKQKLLCAYLLDNYSK